MTSKGKVVKNGKKGGCEGAKYCEILPSLDLKNGAICDIMYNE